MPVLSGSPVTRAVGIAGICLAVVLLLSGVSYAVQTTATADVVVIVDTSTSMKQTDMDPHGTSLLVAKLLSDIVPGNLAVVRLLDIGKDNSCPRQS